MMNRTTSKKYLQVVFFGFENAEKCLKYWISWNFLAWSKSEGFNPKIVRLHVLL